MKAIACAALLATALFAPTPASAAPADVYFERSLMVAADSRCRLFAPDISTALQAGRAQARGAALRTGVEGRELARLERLARTRAGSVACGSRDLKTAASRVQAGFEGYRRLVRLELPGDVTAWRALKSAPAMGHVWRLSQTGRFGADRAVFGLYGGKSAGLGATVTFADGAVPYAARLVVRDPARAPEPYLRGWKPGAKPPLASRTPPASAARAFLAETRMQAPPELAPQPKDRALLLRFPAAATAALLALDPREAVTVEFLFSGRGQDQVRRAYVEVGDFAAGVAFLRLS